MLQTAAHGRAARRQPNRRQRAVTCSKQAGRPAATQQNQQPGNQGPQPQAIERAHRAERRAPHVGTPASHACFSRSRQPPCIRMEAPARASMPFLMPPRMPAGAPAEIV